jgi:hypothetical protein
MSKLKKLREQNEEDFSIATPFKNQGQLFKKKKMKNEPIQGHIFGSKVF